MNGSQQYLTFNNIFMPYKRSKITEWFFCQKNRKEDKRRIHMHHRNKPKVDVYFNMAYHDHDHVRMVLQLRY